MNIARNMAILMYDNKVTARELAKEVGVTEGMIGMVKNGTKIPSVSVLCGIADYFGVTMDELIRGDCSKAKTSSTQVKEGQSNEKA